MKIYVVTDTHFGHQKLIDAGARPADYEERILRNLAKVVKPEDLVIHLGDVWLGDRGRTENFLRDLPGKKVLTLGNHDDRGSLGYFMKHGFDFVCDSFTLKRFGMNIQFSHMPMDGSHFDLNIHGHIHTGEHREYDPKPNQILLSMETCGYQPQLLESLVKAWRKSLCVLLGVS